MIPVADVVVVQHEHADALRQHLTETWRALSDAPWSSPTRREREVVLRGGVLLVRALERCDPDELAVAGAALGGHWAMTVHAAGATRLLVVHEREPHGGPLVALRCGPAVDLVVQAPHSHYDLGTGALAFEVAVHGAARGVMWNTTHRYRALPGERPEDLIHPGDVCAQPASTFQAWSVALAASPELRFVQLHGFGRGEVDVIVSTGDPYHPPAQAAALLQARVGPTATFGLDTTELGATGNALGRALAPGRFLHVELSPGARERLRGAPVVDLLTTLAGVPW